MQTPDLAAEPCQDCTAPPGHSAVYFNSPQRLKVR